MKVSVVPIGNSRGVRIPKAILDQCHIGNEVELEVKEGRVVLTAIEGKPRDGWGEAFAGMAEVDDDRLLIDDAIDLDSEAWQW